MFREAVTTLPPTSHYDGFVDASDFGLLVESYGTPGETFATSLMITQKNLQPTLTWAVQSAYGGTNLPVSRLSRNDTERCQSDAD